MSEAIPAQKGPYGFDVEAGRKYFWCACGRSKQQPFCVGELADIQRYREGAGRDLTDVALTAQIAGIDGDCTFGRNEVGVTMKVAIVGDRGPALQGDTAEVDYFVAITAPGETQPRAKQV